MEWVETHTHTHTHNPKTQTNKQKNPKTWDPSLRGLFISLNNWIRPLGSDLPAYRQRKCAVWSSNCSMDSTAGSGFAKF